MSFLWLSLTKSRNMTGAKINMLLWRAKYFLMFPPQMQRPQSSLNTYYALQWYLLNFSSEEWPRTTFSEHRSPNFQVPKPSPSFVPFVFEILKIFIHVFHNSYFNFLGQFSSCKTQLKMIPLMCALSSFLSLFQEVFWRKDRTLFCMAGFIHRIPHSIFSNWDYCISIWMYNHWKWHSKVRLPVIHDLLLENYKTGFS